MKALSLSRRIFLLAFINVALLFGVFLVFAHHQLHLEFGSFLLAPVRERLEDVAASVVFDLEETPVDQRTSLMGRYAADYGVDFYLFDNDGPQLAGQPVQLPAEVLESLRRGGREGPPEGRERRPPGKGPPRPGPPPPREDPPPPQRPGRGGGSIARQTFQLSAADIFWVGTRIPIAEPDRDQIKRGTLILAAKSFYGTPLFFDFKPWLAALSAVIAIFLVCWLPFIRSLTKTISGITKAAGEIEKGNFDRQLNEDRGDELGQLSIAINRMAARLSGFVSGQKRFLGDIAHELCAPIARMQFGLGILEQQTHDAVRPALEDVQEEMRQMSGLVAELLSFSKAGMESKERRLEMCDVREIACQAVSREAGNEDSVQVAISEPLMVLADREYLLRALSNLVRNAVRYAGAAGPISIPARRDHREVVISVSDSGPGLPRDELDRIFTPFYRLETSRNREHGGAGLGLAIVKSCVEACKGTVRCRNRQPAGLEVEVRLASG
jgi:two-component system, OmpR family, sensor histidine kinase CpxA